MTVLLLGNGEWISLGLGFLDLRTLSRSLKHREKQDSINKEHATCLITASGVPA